MTAPLTEVIDHAGYFIQMSMASLPDVARRHPQQEVSEVARPRIQRGRHRRATCRPGLRVLEASLLRRFAGRRRGLLLSRTTCTSSSARTRASWRSPRTTRSASRSPPASTRRSSARRRQPINSHYARELFAALKANPYRNALQGDRRRIGRLADRADRHATRSSASTASSKAAANRTRRSTLFAQGAPRRGRCRARSKSAHPEDARRASSLPDKRTTFGVVEMTTGCGRRCQFCLPDLNPQIDVPKEQDHGGASAPTCATATSRSRWRPKTCSSGARCTPTTPFYFPNREALLDLYSDIVNTPGVEQHVLSHCDDRAGGGRSAS